MYTQCFPELLTLCGTSVATSLVQSSQVWKQKWWRTKQGCSSFPVTWKKVVAAGWVVRPVPQGDCQAHSPACTWKGCFRHAKKVPVKKKEWHHTKATTLEELSPSGKPRTAGQVSSRQRPLESILLWEKANIPRNVGSELPSCLQKEKYPF